jgi:hypothetical protein
MNVMCLYLQARSMVPLSFTHQDLHIAPSFFSMNYPVFASSCEHGIYYTLTQFAWCRDVEIAWQQGNVSIEVSSLAFDNIFLSLG